MVIFSGFKYYLGPWKACQPWGHNDYNANRFFPKELSQKHLESHSCIKYIVFPQRRLCFEMQPLVSLFKSLKIQMYDISYSEEVLWQLPGDYLGYIS